MRTQTLGPDTWSLTAELFEAQEAERRALQRLRLARHTLKDCRRAAREAAETKARVEARILTALGR